MPKIKRIRKKDDNRVTFRLDEDTRQFYKAEAESRNIDLSEYIRQSVMRGLISDNAEKIQENFIYITSKFLEEFIDTASKVQENGKNVQAAIPDEVIRSIFTIEEILKKLVLSENIQAYYKVKDNAQARLEELKSESNSVIE